MPAPRWTFCKDQPGTLFRETDIHDLPKLLRGGLQPSTRGTVAATTEEPRPRQRAVVVGIIPECATEYFSSTTSGVKTSHEVIPSSCLCIIPPKIAPRRKARTQAVPRAAIEEACEVCGQVEDWATNEEGYKVCRQCGAIGATPMVVQEVYARGGAKGAQTQTHAPLGYQRTIGTAKERMKMSPELKSAEQFHLTAQTYEESQANVGAQEIRRLMNVLDLPPSIYEGALRGFREAVAASPKHSPARNTTLLALVGVYNAALEQGRYLTKPEIEKQLIGVSKFVTPTVFWRLVHSVSPAVPATSQFSSVAEAALRKLNLPKPVQQQIRRVVAALPSQLPLGHMVTPRPEFYVGDVIVLANQQAGALRRPSHALETGEKMPLSQSSIFEALGIGPVEFPKVRAHNRAYWGQVREIIERLLEEK